MLGRGTMLIPRPLDVDAAMRRVPRGWLVTPRRIRVWLARDAGADATCALTCGIFVRIAAEAAEEDRRAGRKHVTPWWRVVRENGALIDRFPGGVAEQARRLRAEGIAVLPRSGRRGPRVADLATRLVTS